ncbi:aldehyde reductase [Favolaschia claudopus]|uniref:Aldehyde reductase n=1 Tax=Favolaschia claudopus TaxID=2862362 RepID=A0AAW0CS26_9AGAR
MSTPHVKAVFGGFSIGPGQYFSDEENIKKIYDLLEKGGCDTIDTARLYGRSEEFMGRTGAGGRFTIDSKTPGGIIPGGSTGEGILQHAKESVERLKVKSLDVYYIHAPDPSLDLEDQLKGINEAFKAGYFKRFGLSNFTAPDVQRVYDICRAKGYPCPTVFQANYNPVARRAEEDLIPLLRRLNIALYVYSPIAGGLLTKTSEQLRGKGPDAGRFGAGDALEKLYGPMYNKPAFYEALDLWGEAAKDAGCSRAELAYRWVAFDSAIDYKYGDAVIFGASKHSQIPETLGWLRGGSVGEAAKVKIEAIWKLIEHVAPLDNYNSTRH